MKIEDKGRFKILSCELGYLIHNKKSDTYSSKVYLGNNASLDDFEEVVDEIVDEKVAKKISKVSANVDILNEVNDEQDSLIIDLFTEISILLMTGGGL